MVMVIDFIETESKSEAAGVWKAVGGFLASGHGYIDGHLLEVFDAMHPRIVCPLISVTKWRDARSWHNVRNTAKADSGVRRALESTQIKFNSLTAEFVMGQEFEFSDDVSRMILFDVIYVAADRAEAYTEMWALAAEFMGKQPGFYNASLYKNVDASGAIRFVNIAEWQTTDRFFQAVNAPEFLGIVDDFRNDFALHLSHRKIRQAASHTAAQIGVDA